MIKAKHRKPLIALALAGLLFSIHTAHAAVTFVTGSLTDDPSNQISSWSSSTVTKTRDIGTADNRDGTDGYTWMNAASNGGEPNGSGLANIVQSAPNYASGIAYTSTTTGGAWQISASFRGADDRLLPNGTGSANVGYAGVKSNSAAGNPQNTIQQRFAYTMTRSMFVGETIRLGVVLDSLNELSAALLGGLGMLALLRRRR